MHEIRYLWDFILEALWRSHLVWRQQFEVLLVAAGVVAAIGVVVGEGIPVLLRMTPKSLRALTTRPFCGAGAVMFKAGAVVFTTGGEHTHYGRYTLPSFCVTASGKQNKTMVLVFRQYRCEPIKFRANLSYKVAPEGKNQKKNINIPVLLRTTPKSLRALTRRLPIGYVPVLRNMRQYSSCPTPCDVLGRISCFCCRRWTHPS